MVLLSLSIISISIAPTCSQTTWTLIWSGIVYSSGEIVIPPVILQNGEPYKITSREVFWYNYAANLAADSMYYTTDPSDHWNWGSYAYAGHSFLQVDGGDVDFGDFRNGDMGHYYSAIIIGKGAQITLQIVDWVDADYTNNDSHFLVEIFRRTSERKYDPVGGELLVANKLLVITPYIALSGIIGIASIFFIKKNK